MSRYTSIAICNLLVLSSALSQSVTVNLGIEHWQIFASSTNGVTNWTAWGSSWGVLRSPEPYVVSVPAASGYLVWRERYANTTNGLWGAIPLNVVKSNGGGSISMTNNVWTVLSGTNVVTGGAFQGSGPAPTPSPTPTPWNLSATLTDPPVDMIGKTMEIRDMDTGQVLGSALIGANGATLSFTAPSGVNNIGTYVDGQLVGTGSRSGGSTVMDPSPVQFNPEGVGGSITLSNYAGQPISIRHGTTGQVLASAVVGPGGTISKPATTYAPVGVTPVNYYLGNTLIGSGTITNNSGSTYTPSSWNYSPTVTANPFTISANPGASAFGSSGVQGQIVYQGGATGSGLTPGQVVWSGTIPSGGTGAIITNLALPSGSIFTVQAQVPQYVYTNLGDGIGGYVPTSTNTYTFATNVPAGSGNQTIYVQAPASNSLPPPILASSNNSAFPSNSFSSSITTTNIVTITNSVGSGTNSGTNSEPVEVSFTGMEFINEDYGESALPARGASLLGKITGTISNVTTGFSNIATAATTFAGVSVPSASGGCSVNLGGHTITLSSPPGVREALVYLAWLGVIIAIGSMLWDLTKS